MPGPIVAVGRYDIHVEKLRTSEKYTHQLQTPTPPMLLDGYFYVASNADVGF